MLPGARTRRVLVPAALVLLLGTGLAGCLGDGLSFGTLAPAVWAPGFAWEWNVETEEEGDFQGPGGTGSGTMRVSSKMRDEVAAVAETTDGHSVYVVKSSGPTEGGSWDNKRLRIVDKADLSTLAVAYGEDVECIGVSELSRVHHGEELLSLVDFPLEAGGEYTVEWEGLQWTAKVGGQDRVELPAGRFDAIRLDFSASGPESGDVDVGDAVAEPMSEPASPTPTESTSDEYVSEEHVEGTISIWYAAAAHNIVRADMEMSYRHTEEDGSYTYTQRARMELSSISLDLVEGPELGPIKLPTENGWVQPPSLRIVTDTAFPLNTATENATATFWLEAFDRRAPWEEGIPVRETVDPYVPSGVYEGHTIRWAFGFEMHHMTDAPGPGIPYGDSEPGGSISVDFPLYGQFEVVAWLEPPQETVRLRAECSEHGAHPFEYRLAPLMRWPIAEAYAEVHYEDHYTVEQAAGFAESFELARFEVPETVGEALVEYHVSMDLPLPADDASVFFISPSGEEYSVGSGSSLELAEAGEWTVEWRGHGQYGSGVSPGYEADIHLFIQRHWAYY